VFAISALIDALTSTGPAPAPGAGLHGALRPYAELVPYSKMHSPTSTPFGLTVAVNVADSAPIVTAGAVTTAGGPSSILPYA
jgi:hypothetical protein